VIYIITRNPTNDKYKKLNGKSHSDVYREYNTVFRMTLHLAQAAGSIVLSGRDVLRITGIGMRLLRFNRILDQIEEALSPSNTTSSCTTTVTSANENEKMSKKKTTTDTETKMKAKNKIISVRNLCVTLPSGETLIKSLQFDLRTGCNTLLVGPNGSGKSSLLRLLARVWENKGDNIVWHIPALITDDVINSCLPQSNSRPRVMFLSQKPYMPLGTLEDQIIYPLTKEIYIEQYGITESRLYEILYGLMVTVCLDHLLVDMENEDEKEAEEIGANLHACGSDNSGDNRNCCCNGKECTRWHSVEDWSDVLSGGEKQRLCMARLFLHRPVLAVLDECTSAVSVDVEQILYKHCLSLGITILSVSHRPSLIKFHERYIRLDGKGGSICGDIDIENFQLTTS
jgi:ATP-binding cassette, subfamily D (ALD), member 3